MLKRNLVLTSPYMSGDDVRDVQDLLNVKVDGEFGPITAGAAKQWKYEFGMKDSQVKPNLTTGEYPYLAGHEVAGPFMLLNRKRRKTTVVDTRTVAEKATDRMVHWASKGYKETVNNVVPELSKLASSTGLSWWYTKMGWPWCAFAVFLAARAEGLRVGPQKLGFEGKFNVLYCPDILATARRGEDGLRVVGRKDVRKGDLVLFDFQGDGVVDHIGRYVSAGPNGLVTVEGNTSYDDGGSQANGGAVAVRNRSWSQVTAIVREDY